MAITRNSVSSDGFNTALALPFELRLEDFRMAVRDVYDFFCDVNSATLHKDGIAKLRESWVYRFPSGRV